MSIAPLAFTGVSTYSNDFQTILTRAGKIASLPLTALQNQNADVLQEQTQLSALGNSVSGLGASLAKLAGFGDNKALSAQSSNSSVVTATNTASTVATSYTINEITSLATTASETSLAGYANSQSTAVSTTGTVNLTVGSNSYILNISQRNNLVGLRDTINSLGAGVSASILTAGTTNYLSISAATPGQTALTLKDDPTGANTDLLTSLNQGSNAEFKLNGIAVSRKSNTVNDLIPGLAFSLQTKSSAPVTLSLSTDRNVISSALQDFVSNLNTANAAVSQQVGANAGLLSGNFLVRQIQENLRSVTAYSTQSGAVKNLTDLGITFDTAGKASFDATAFSQLPDASINSALTFFGSARTGLGEIAQRFNQITDPVAGLIKIQNEGYTQADLRLQSQIATLSERIAASQASLQAKLQVADTLLAQLASQQSVIAGQVQSLNFSAFGKASN